MFYAARLGDVSIVNTVLERLTKEDAKTGELSRNYGRCELTEAVKYDRMEVVKRLYPLQLEVCGASIKTGIKHNRMAVVQWLLSQQSEADQANRANQTQWLSNAFESGSLEMIRYVQSLGIVLDNQIAAYAARAARNDQPDIFEDLVTQGYEFDTNPNVYSGALNNAINGGAVRVIDYLIAQGVSLNKPSACSPPLHSAIRGNQRELFFKLVKLDTPQSDPCSLKPPCILRFMAAAQKKIYFYWITTPSGVWRRMQRVRPRCIIWPNAGGM